MSVGCNGRVIAIGDIHGCIHALEAILDAVVPAENDRIIVLGDFVDLGCDTRDVLDRLIALNKAYYLVTIIGNHEEMLLAALTQPALKESWLVCGGVATLNSYYFGADMEAIPEDHLDFIRGGQNYWETEHYIFTHANYDADLPLAKQPQYTLRWALLDDPQPKRHISGKKVVVGHTEQRNGEILNLGCLIGLDTWCYGHGWLTALDVTTGKIWQANRWGILRDSE